MSSRVAAAAGSRSARLDPTQLGGDRPAPLHQFVIGLQAEEEPLRHAEIPGKPQVGIGGDGALAQDNLVNAARNRVNGAPSRSG